MAKRVPISVLNANSIDILNTIRANASSNYQSLVPEISVDNEIPHVGEIIMGYPAIGNEFISVLLNRIALHKVRSLIFNNKFSKFKKGYLEFGETIYDSYIEIAKAQEFSEEKAPQREFKRTIPDVRTAFYVMNYKAIYPITIEDDALRQAFLSADGLINFIDKIVNALYMGAEYDEFLLFKYLIIKGVTSGKLYPVLIGDGTDLKEDAVVYRTVSNTLPFVSTKYNQAHVHTTTEKSEQYIFMTAEYNAKYDVNVLASAFNMDKADFMGKLELIDNWDEFDNDRFSQIMEATDYLPPVTAQELAIMKKVNAIMVDPEWFQFYDNLIKLNETFVGSGDYRNYWLITKKTIATSPFANAIAFITDDTLIEMPSEITLNVVGKETSETATIITVSIDDSDPALVGTDGIFVQTEDATEKGIAVHRFGAYIFPKDTTSTDVEVNVNGTIYKGVEIATTNVVGDTITITKQI